MKKKSKPRPTLADVARRANVSVMTVSNVVNGRSDLVREKTRQRVAKVVTALGYRPHVHARALRLSRSWTIGMMVTARMRDFPAAPWLSEILSGLSNHLNERGYSLLLHNQDALQMDASALLKWSRTDGLVAMMSGTSAERHSILSALSRLDQPVIALQEPDAPPANWDVAVVRQDDFGGGALLGEHLLAGRARRLVFLRPDSDWPAMRERARGMASVTKEATGASVRSIQCHDQSYAAVETALMNEIAQHGLPDAFVGTNESIAHAALNALGASGYSIPDDVALAGFNKSEIWFFAKRKITTIEFPPYQIGAEAARLMLDRLEKGTFHKNVLVLAAELIAGDTTLGFAKRPKLRSMS
jgi:DNA-binding LacI/PurR family transcriptional regulator